MTTALQIVNRAAEIVGFKDPDESLSGNDSNNFLGVLNSMLDSWNTQRLYIATVAQVSASVSASPTTIGSGATFNTTRPVRLEDGCFSRSGGVDYPIQVIGRSEYDLIVDKATTSSFPDYVYYEPALPTGNLYFYPVPSPAVAVYLQVQTQLTEFADLSTDYTLAPGYKKALEYSLAEELAPGRRPLDLQVVRQAAIARRAVKTTNFESPQLEQADFLTPYQRFVAGV